jgi:hypothetical protein
VTDYLYLFNPKTFEYSKIAENNTNFSAGPRFGHSGKNSKFKKKNQKNSHLFFLYLKSQLYYVTIQLLYCSVQINKELYQVMFIFLV